MKEHSKYTITNVREGIHTIYRHDDLLKRPDGNEMAAYVWGQAISTIHEYLGKNPTEDRHFQPYFFFTEKDSDKILLGRILTYTPKEGGSIEINGVDIFEVFDDVESILKEKFAGGFYCPEQVKVYSDAFKKLLGKQFEDFSKKMNTYPR